MHSTAALVVLMQFTYWTTNCAVDWLRSGLVSLQKLLLLEMLVGDSWDISHWVLIFDMTWALMRTLVRTLKGTLIRCSMLLRYVLHWTVLCWAITRMLLWLMVNIWRVADHMVSCRATHHRLHVSSRAMLLAEWLGRHLG